MADAQTKGRNNTRKARTEHSVCSQNSFIGSSGISPIGSDPCQKSERLIPARCSGGRFTPSPHRKRGCKRAAGAERLGGSSVGSDQAKPGKVLRAQVTRNLNLLPWVSVCCAHSSGSDWRSAKSVVWS